MKKIVKGNDFTLKIPVMKMVEGQAQAFPLPACTDVVVQVCNQFKRIPLAFEIDVQEDNVLLARVEGDKMSLGTYAIEVKGKIFGNDWRSNEYPQFAIVATNADADTEFGETDEGDNSVEMDTAMVILPPTVELSDLIEKTNEALKNNKETNDTINANESARKEAETLRDTAEQGRVSAEETRASAEGDRTEAEEARMSAEAERVRAEQARTEIEITRQTNELTRNDNESRRVAAEGERVKAEEARVDAENSRANAESERVDAEAQRTSAESGRSNAETGRASAEVERVKAENKRQSDTDAAIGNMNDRIETAIRELNTHRTEFDEAEAQRVSAENERVEAEKTRKQTEADRVSAEGARAEAEQARVDAETKRKSDFDTAIRAAETATEGAEKVNATITDANVFEVTGRGGVKKSLELASQADAATIKEGLAGKFDKASIVQESGEDEDKVMSQKATTTAIEAAVAKNEEQDKKLSELDIKVNGGETDVVVDKSSQIDGYAMLVTTLDQTSETNTATQVFPIEVGKMYKVNVPQSLNTNFYTIALSDREVTTAGWSSSWLKKVPNSAGNSQPLNIDIVGEDGYPYMLISYNPIAGEPIVKTTIEVSSIFATKEELNNEIEPVINDISTVNNKVSIINETLYGKEPPIPTTLNLAVNSGENESTYEQRVAFNFEANKEYKISIKNYNGSALSSPVGIYFSISQIGVAKAEWFPNKVPAETIFSSDINLSYVWAHIRREDNSTAASFDIDIQENNVQQKGIVERVNEISSKVYNCTPISGFYNTIKKISDDMVDGATLLVGEGTYDLYAELGGATFANTITSGDWADWNILTTPNLKIIGVGDVLLKMNIEHSELESTSRAEEFLSAINVRKSITIENLTIDCGNCRYAIHIEGSEAEDNNNQIFNIKNCKVLRTSTSYGKNAAIGIGINKGCTLNIEDSIIDSNIGFGIGGHLNNGAVVMNSQNSVIKGGGGYQSWYMGTQWNSALSKINFYGCYCPIINVEGNSSNHNAMFEFTFFRTPTTLTKKDNIEHCEFKAYDCEVTDNQ